MSVSRRGRAGWVMLMETALAREARQTRKCNQCVEYRTQTSLAYAMEGHLAWQSPGGS
jgi:hypothetical protein